MEHKIHTIDAKDEILGRLASRVATLLSGKHKPDFVRYKDMGDTVVIENVNQVKISGKKIAKKQYYHHTGYIGKLKAKPLKILLKENPAEVLKKAVWGMLPKNKLRAKMIKRLKFK